MAIKTKKMLFAIEKDISVMKKVLFVANTMLRTTKNIFSEAKTIFPAPDTSFSVPQKTVGKAPPGVVTPNKLPAITVGAVKLPTISLQHAPSAVAKPLPRV
jgi:hypothetical protein